MLTSKQRADLRAQANDLDTTLMVGKGGVTENVLSEAARQLEARELVKGRVLEAALLSAREVCDALCEALGAVRRLEIRDLPPLGEEGTGGRTAGARAEKAQVEPRPARGAGAPPAGTRGARAPQ